MNSSVMKCPCSPDKEFSNCCKPFIDGIQQASTPALLMRSRYSAYATGNIDYLLRTTHSTERGNYTRKDLEEWSLGTKWLKLEILRVEEYRVEFKAYFIGKNGVEEVHHELSTLFHENGEWYFVDGIFGDQIYDF